MARIAIVPCAIGVLHVRRDRRRRAGRIVRLANDASAAERGRAATDGHRHGLRRRGPQASDLSWFVMALAAAIAVKPIGGRGPTLLMAIGAAIFAIAHPSRPGRSASRSSASVSCGSSFVANRRLSLRRSPHGHVNAKEGSPLSAPAPKKHHIAARMGHWSATHRKTAIFGWLGFVIVAFAIGTFVVTQQQIVYETSQPGESGRAEDPLRGLHNSLPASILIQHPELLATNPAFQAVVQDVVSSVESVDARCREGRVAARRREPRAGLRRQTRGARGAGDRGRVRQGDRQDRSGRHADQGGAEREPRLLRRVGRRQHPGTSRKPSSKIWPRRGSSRFDHPDHPDRRVRSARRRGIPLLLGITAILATMGLISIWSGDFRWRKPSARWSC